MKPVMSSIRSPESVTWLLMLLVQSFRLRFIARVLASSLDAGGGGLPERCSEAALLVSGLPNGLANAAFVAGRALSVFVRPKLGIVLAAEKSAADSGRWIGAACGADASGDNRPPSLRALLPRTSPASAVLVLGARLSPGARLPASPSSPALRRSKGSTSSPRASAPATPSGNLLAGTAALAVSAGLAAGLTGGLVCSPSGTRPSVSKTKKASPPSPSFMA